MHDHHHHFLHFLKNRELNELYFSIAIRSFALSMIGIFIPIYLLKLGYSLPSVLIFFAILAGTHMLCVAPAAKIASRFGFKHAIFFSVPILIVFYILLYSLEQFRWPLALVAILFGINNALFWIGYHVDFSKFSDKKKRGEEVGIAKIVSSLFHVIGPLAGGLILVFVGFKVLFIIVSALLVVSIVPLFFSKDIHDPEGFSFKGIFKGRKIKDGISFAAFGVDSGLGMLIWPIFIFFVILSEQYTSLGLVSSLSLFFSLAFVFVIAKFSDMYRKLVLRIGAIANSIVWIIRSFVITSLHVFIIDSFAGMTRTSIAVPFDAISYDKANKSNIVKFIVFREILINLGRALIFLVMILISDLVSGFVFGAGASLLYLLF